MPEVSRSKSSLIFTLLPKRFVTGPGEIIANGAGQRSASRETEIRRRSAGLEWYLGIGRGVIPEALLKALKLINRAIGLICKFIFKFGDPDYIDNRAQDSEEWH